MYICARMYEFTDVSGVNGVYVCVTMHTSFTVYESSVLVWFLLL